MQIGLLITTYNRPAYLKECLESINRAEFPTGTRMCIIDDASTDEKMYDLLHSIRNNGIEEINLLWRNTNGGIKACLNQGCQTLISEGCDLLINLDGDAIIRNDFISVLVNLHNRFPDHIVTGFNCNTLNSDGSVRHQIESEGDGYNIKKSVGGINMVFTPKMFYDWIQPALETPLLNWDHETSKRAGNGIICSVPSVINHIGLESSMGHSGVGREAADTAEDFKPLSLPMVTLIGADSNTDRLRVAFDESMKDIEFGGIVQLQPDLRSKEQYSDYCIKHLYKEVKTSHLLIVQWDGYVKNWKAWNNDWLQYDYIGAPWEWYNDGHNVGNGGFSLRSRRLMEVVATDINFSKDNHPEDHVICRVKRKYLEEKYGIKFAPVEVARKFSIEGHNHWNKTHVDQFGFHSMGVKFADRPQTGIGKTAYIQQYFGIGDVIFSMQIARNIQRMGYKICWPVLPDYVEQLNRAYPDITFMDVWLTQPKFMENRELIARGSTYYVPLRYTYELMKVPFKNCMRSKYDFMQMDWKTWTAAMYERDLEREKKLMAELGIKEGEPFTLVNRLFRSDNKGHAQFPAPNGKVIEMKPMDGYSLFDWSMVIQNATEIHTVSTSIVYIFELLELKAEKIYIYIRKPQEANHDNYRELLTRHIDKYIFEPNKL